MLPLALLSKVVIATLIACIATCVRRTDRRPEIGFALWAAVLLVLLVPPVLTLPVGVPARVASALSVSAPGLSVLVDEVRTSLDDPAVARSPVALAAVVAKAPRTAFTSVDGLDVALWLSAIAWFTGAVVLLGRQRASSRAVASVVSCARIADEDVCLRAIRIARSLGVTATPRVVIADGAFSPFLWQPFRAEPTIVLPRDLEDRLDRAELDAILRHEVMHVGRRDAVRHRAESIAVVLWWWLPTTWIAVRRIREFEELCIDRAVVRARPAEASNYARALLSTEEFLAESTALRMATNAVPALVRPGLIERRVRGIVDAKRSPSSARSRVLAVLVVAFVLPLGAITAVGAPRGAASEPPVRVDEGISATNIVSPTRAWPRPRGGVAGGRGTQVAGTDDTSSNAVFVSISTMVDATAAEFESVSASIREALENGATSVEAAYERIVNENERLRGTGPGADRSDGFRLFERRLKRAWRAGEIDERQARGAYARALALEESGVPIDDHVDLILFAE